MPAAPPPATLALVPRLDRGTVIGGVPATPGRVALAWPPAPEGLPAWRRNFPAPA